MATKNLFGLNPLDRAIADTKADFEPLGIGYMRARAGEDQDGLPDARNPILPERPRSVSIKDPSSLAPPQALMPLFQSAASRYKVPVHIIMALAQQESSYRPDAVGVPTKWGRAMGMMQYLDSTAKNLGINPFDPAQAIDAAAKQIRERLDKGYSMEDAVKEHFAGPDRRLWGPKTRQYGIDVMGKAQALAGMFGQQPADAPALPQAAAPQFGTPEYDELVRRQMADIDRQSAEQAAPFLSPASEETEQDDVSLLSDMAQQGVGAIYKGFGATVRGLGALPQVIGEYTTTPLINKIFGTDYRTRNLLDKPADALKEYGEKMQAGVSEATREAIKQSTPDGDLFDPKTWTFGESPSAVGYMALGLDVLGQMLPVVAATVATGGAGAATRMGTAAAVGGAQGGGAGVEEAHDIIDELAGKKGESGKSLLEEQSAYYRELRAKGYSEKEAVERTKDAAGHVAFMLTAPVSAAGGMATAKIINPAEKLLSGQNIGVRVAGRAALGGLEEGTQEVTEGVQTRRGVNIGAGTDVSVTEGSFADFVLGSIGGSVPGAAGGALSRREPRGTGITDPDAPVGTGIGPDAPPAPPQEEQAQTVMREDTDGNLTVRWEEEAPQVDTRGPLQRGLDAADEAAAARRVVVTTPVGQITGFLEAFAEDAEGGFVARVLGDDGLMHQFTHVDPVTIEPEADFVARTDAQEVIDPDTGEILSGAPDADIRERPDGGAAPIAQDEPNQQSAGPADAASPATTWADTREPEPGGREDISSAGAQPEPVRSLRPDYGSMTVDELNARLEYLSNQAAINGGWNTMLIRERDRVRAAIRSQLDADEAQDQVSEQPQASESGDAAAATPRPSSVTTPEGRPLVELFHPREGVHVLVRADHWNSDRESLPTFNSDGKRNAGGLSSVPRDILRTPERTEPAGIEQADAAIDRQTVVEPDAIPESAFVDDSRQEPTDEERLAGKRALYQAVKDTGTPDDIAAATVLKAQETANELGAPISVWRSLDGGTIGRVPQGQKSPFRNSELLGTIYPDATSETDAPVPQEGGTQSGSVPQEGGTQASSVQAETNDRREKALQRIAAGRAWFGDEAKARTFIDKNGLADTHTVEQTGAKRFEVVAKQAGAATSEVVSVQDLIAESTPIGMNGAGEALYENERGRFRVRTDRADRPDGYPDFGGDLAPVQQAATSDDAGARAATTQPAPAGASEPNLEAARALLQEQRDATGDKKREAAVKRKIRALAKKTPISDERTVLTLDMAATRLDMEGLEFAEPAPVDASETFERGGREWEAEARPGKGLIKGKFLPYLNGESTPGGPFDTAAEAIEHAKSYSSNVLESEENAKRDQARMEAVRDKVERGEALSKPELDFLNLREGSSDLRWFIPNAARLFGLTSREVRPLISGLIRVGHNDMGTKFESVPTNRALQQMASALREEAAPSDARSGEKTAPAVTSTAPEHAQVGVDDRELAQIVSEFNEAQESMQQDGEQVHHLFDPPAKGDIVRLQDKVRVYHKKHGWMTPAEARALIDEWKAHAAAQGETSQNADKVVLSLFDYTGQWSQPWEDAGYQVFRFDIQNDPEMGDVNNFSTDFFNDWFGSFDGQDIYAILAACPCTDFASSGARHFAAKDKDGRTVASVRLVHQTLAAIEYFKPAIWAIENPVGRIEKLGGLPPWRLSFDPNHIGDPYTKKTLLWGRFNADLPIAPVEPTEGSKMHSRYGGSSIATKNARSVTPEGFAYGFFMANNAVDNPKMAVSFKYDRLNADLIGEAIDAGMTEHEISEVVDDHYYMDLDDQAAEAAIRKAIDARKPDVKADNALAASLGDVKIGDVLTAENGEVYRVEGVDGDKIRTTRNPNQGSERTVLMQQDRFDRLVGEHKAVQQAAIDAARQQATPHASPDPVAPTVVEVEPEPSPVDGRFANNKIFTADKVAAARARLRAKLGQINSGIDPETLIDGMTIAGAYIEEGVRDFTEYARQMVADLGDGVKPYLLSFWEGARNYPGLDTKGMTSVEDSRSQFESLLQPTDAQTSAIGEVAEKPAKRRKKTGAKSDMTLTQDWGVAHIDGYSDDYNRETGNTVKDAFIKEARDYLNAVSNELLDRGYFRHADNKGKPMRPVSVNEGGVAGSGDISLTMAGPDGTGVYIHIGDTALRGVVPTTQSGIAIMFRAAQNSDRFGVKGTNQWAPVDLSAADLAALVDDHVKIEANRNERPAEPTIPAADRTGAPQAAARRKRAAQQDTPQLDFGDLEAGQPQNVGTPAAPETDGQAGLRPATENVGTSGGTDAGRASGNRRSRAGGARNADAGTGSAGSAESRRSADRVSATKSPETVSPANEGPGDFIIDDPLRIVGGGQVARFNKNRAAITLRNQLIDEGRKPTREEQEVLAGYTGWGSFGQELFQGTWNDPKPKQGWEERDQWLRDNLGQKEWEGLQKSIINAHYTDPPTVLAMWDMVKRAGFDGGRVLEPSIGIGNFFGMMPPELAGRSQRAGIELDPVTGSMAQMLYPKANIQIKGYEESKTPDNFYDLVIGNWPFADFSPADRRYDRINPMLHDYFFLKALDQTRPGGLVVGITSSGTMDKKSSKIRTEIAKRGELVAAFRLPSGAFEEYAGTKVVTDILVLRKRSEPAGVVAGEGWISVKPFKTRQGTEIEVNEYYLANPDHVIGEIDYGHGTTTGRPGMIVHRPENMMEQLRRIVELVPEGAYRPDTRGEQISYITNHLNDRTNSLVKTDDGLFVVRGEFLAPANEVQKYRLKSEAATAEREAQLSKLIDMRRMYGELIEAERAGDATAQRTALREAYEAFKKEHKGYSESFGLKYLRQIDDPFYPALAALEVPRTDSKGKVKYEPALILSESTIRGAKQLENPTISDAFVLARNESVNPSPERIAEIAGRPVEEVRRELVESGAAFETPGGDFVPADMYLSGNVREKLRQAKAGLEAGNATMQRNIDALSAVVPADIPYYKIETQFGATWVPSSVYEQYVAHMLGLPDAGGISVKFHAGAWKIDFPSQYNHRAEAKTGFGTPEVPFKRLVRAAIANQTINVKRKDSDGNEYVDQEATKEANARIADIRLKFSEWLWSDPERRVDLEQEYNETRNAYATAKFDGSFLNFPGMALSLGRGPFDLRQHQINAIWRALVMKRSLNAHEVGTGKAQPLDAKILTPSGWKLMGDIAVGDTVITQSGKPTVVEAVFPQGEKEIFRVTFSDGSFTECCDEHLWLTQTYKERTAAVNERRFGRDWESAKPKVRSLAEIRGSLVGRMGAKNHSIPVVEPVQFEHRSVLLDPYLMGVLLGDGGMSHWAVTITSADPEIIDGLKLPENIELRRNESNGRCPTWALRMKKQSGFGANREANPAVAELERLGLMGKTSKDKFIPDDYLLNDVQSRISLLQGLLDTDGYVSKNGGSVYFYTISDDLADGVVSLVQSLGGVVRRSLKNPTYRHNGVVKTGAPAHVLCLSLPPSIEPFRLARKAAMVKPRTRYLPKRYIVDVQPVGKKQAQCIRVSDPSHLYVTDAFIVTHNTFTMGGIAVESRRYGIAKKPMLFAHNANSKTVAAEIQQMYPAAKVLYVDNLSKDNIKTRMMQIANDDWDVVVLPHSLIDRIGFKEETLMEMAQQELADLEEAAREAAAEDGAEITDEMLEDEEALKKLRSPTAKQLVKQRFRILNTIKKLSNQASRDDSIAFEDLGVDMILVDEAHEFKKPPIATKMKMKGLQTQTSNRSIAMSFITRYVRGMNSGGNVHLFTGTPITNTMTEVFHMMRYIMQEEMEQHGLADWDGWFGSFAREVEDVELSSTGEYETVTRLQAFINVPELRRMIGQYMDVVFADDMPEMQPRRVNGKTLSDPTLTEEERAELLNGRTENAADRPYKKVVNDSADMSPEQLRVFERVQQLATRWRNMTKKERKEAMAAGDETVPIIYDGIAERASFDVRLVDAIENAGKEGTPEMEPHPDSKPARVVKNLIEIYRSHPNANQVVFMEQGISNVVTRSEGPPGAKRQIRHKAFSTLNDMVERLVQAGIPREQIAVVTGATDKSKRKEIAEAMNRGDIRIVFGSTDSLGVGVNMQKNLRAMHHMDAPWMPGELEQRNGRGHRQGNQWNTVMEYRYLTDRLDGRRWQVLAIKQRFITDFMKSKGEARVIEGDAAADEQGDILSTFADAAGDPRILVREKLKKKLEGLQSRERLHGHAQADAARQVRRLTDSIADQRGKLKAFVDNKVADKAAALMDAQRGDGFRATIFGQRFASSTEARDFVRDMLPSELRIGQSKVIGTYGDYELRGEWGKFSNSPHLTLEIGGQVVESNGPSLPSLAGAIRDLRDMQGSIEKRIQNEEATLERMRAVSQEPFHLAGQLEAVEKQLADLERDIAENPVAPPHWLRAGAPTETAVFWKGKEFTVTGHRWNKTGWYVLAEDESGSVAIPYMEAMDSQGMPLYEEHEFSPPTIIDRNAEQAAQAGAGIGAEVKFSVSGNVGTAGTATRADIERAVTGGQLGGVVKRLMDAGKIVLHDRADTLPATVRSAAGTMQGFTDSETGTIHLYVPGLTQQTAMPTLLHEAFHGHGESLIGSTRWNNLLKQGARYYTAARARQAEGRVQDGDFWDGALRRVDDAMRQGMVSQGREAEELLAYTAEEFARAPSGVKKWLDTFAGMVKDWLNRRFGVQLGRLTPAQLYAFSRAALRSAGGTTAQAGPMFSVAPDPRTAAFRRWFGDSKVVDEKGNPLVVYHGTGADISTFDPSKTKLADGVFVTPSASYASTFAEASEGGPNVIPLYAKIERPRYIKAKDFNTESFLSATQDGAADGVIVLEEDGKTIHSAFVFEPTQLKSSIGNIGTYDPSNPDIRFSAKEREESLDAAIDELEDDYIPPAKTDHIGRAIRDMDGASGLYQRFVVHPYTIASLYPEFTPVFNTGVSQHQMRNRIIEDLHRDYAQYQALPQKSKESVNKALELGRLTSSVYTDAELRAGVRNPGYRYVVRYDEQGNPRRVRQDIEAALSKSGDVFTLTDAEIEAYKGLRGMFDRALDMFRDQVLTEFDLERFIGQPDAAKAMMEEAEKLPKSSGDRQRLENMAQFIGDIEQSKRTGYVPFTRYGDYVIAVKERQADIKYERDDADGYYAANVPEGLIDTLDRIGAYYDADRDAWHLTEAQRQILEEENEVTIYSEKVETSMRDMWGRNRENRVKKERRPVSDIPSVKKAVDRVMQERVAGNPNRRIVAFPTTKKRPEGGIDMQSLDALAEVAMLDKDTWDAVRDELAKALQAGGFRKHFFHANNVPGYSADFERSIADYIVGLSGYLARRKHNAQWDKAINEIKGAKLHRYATAYRNYVNEPSEEYALLRQTGFFFYIAGNISSAALNATQVPMMTMPFLNQFASHPQATAEMTRAYKQAMAMMSPRAGMEVFDFSKAPADLRDELMRAKEEGLLLPLRSLEIMGAANRRTVEGRRYQRAYDKTTQGFALPFTATERLNRLVTFMAAARLAKKPGMQKRIRETFGRNPMARSMIFNDKGEISAYSFGEFAVGETQFIMGKLNRPTIMRNVGAPIMQFKSFMLQFLEALFMRWPALHGKHGKRARTLALFLMVTMAGMWGFPGADDLRELLEKFYKGVTKKDFDARDWLRQTVWDATGSMWLTRLVDSGAFAAAGADMSQRVGMGQIMPQVREATGIDWLDNVMAFGGIPFDLTIGRLTRAAQQAGRGDAGGALTQFVPDFVENARRALEWSEKGVLTRDQRKMLNPEDVDLNSIILKSMGFQPTQISELYAGLAAERRSQDAVSELRRHLTGNLTRAMSAAARNNDPERVEALDRDIESAMQAIMDHNESATRPEDIIELSNASIRRMMQREMGGAPAGFGREKRAARGTAEARREAYGLGRYAP